jgi:hypothetical protein
MSNPHSALPLPPKEYNAEYMNRLIRQLDIIVNRISSVRPLRGGSDLSRQNVNYPISGLTIENIPTSATGLPSGSVWSDNGTLKIVS